jgi:hypothetical protein
MFTFTLTHTMDVAAARALDYLKRWSTDTDMAELTSTRRDGASDTETTDDDVGDGPTVRDVDATVLHLEELAEDGNACARVFSRKIKAQCEKLDRRDLVDVAFVGASGAGKSYLINSMIGCGDILPSISGKACTATVVRIRPTTDTTADGIFTVRIKYVTERAWGETVDYLCECLADDDMFAKARDELRVMYRQYGDGDRAVDAALTAVTREVAEEDVLKFKAMLTDTWGGAADRFSMEVSSTFNSPRGVGPYIKRAASSCSKDGDWRITESVIVEVPNCEWLRGMEILDLPGNNDVNIIRNRVHCGHVKTADHIVIVMSGQRAATDESADYFVQQRQSDMIAEGKVSGSALSVVITQTDKMDADELADECGEDATPARVRGWIVGQVEERIKDWSGIDDSGVSVHAVAKGHEQGYAAVRSFIRHTVDEIMLDRNSTGRLVIQSTLEDLRRRTSPTAPACGADPKDLRRLIKLAMREINVTEMMPSADALNASVCAMSPSTIKYEDLNRLNAFTLRKIMRLHGDWPMHRKNNPTPLIDHLVDQILLATGAANTWNDFFTAIEVQTSKAAYEKVRRILVTCAERLGVEFPAHVRSDMQVDVRAFRSTTNDRRGDLSAILKAMLKGEYSDTFEHCAGITGRGMRNTISKLFADDARRVIPIVSNKLSLEIERKIDTITGDLDALVKQFVHVFEVAVSSMAPFDELDVREVIRVLEAL